MNNPLLITLLSISLFFNVVFFVWVLVLQARCTIIREAGEHALQQLLRINQNVDTKSPGGIMHLDYTYGKPPAEDSSELIAKVAAMRQQVEDERFAARVRQVIADDKAKEIS